MIFASILDTELFEANSLKICFQFQYKSEELTIAHGFAFVPMSFLRVFISNVKYFVYRKTYQNIFLTLTFVTTSIKNIHVVKSFRLTNHQHQPIFVYCWT